MSTLQLLQGALALNLLRFLLNLICFRPDCMKS